MMENCGKGDSMNGVITMIATTAIEVTTPTVTVRVRERFM
jgi:hypothetical protein